MVAATQQWIIQGLGHAQAGRLQQAEKCYRQVLAFDPNPTTRILLASLVPPVYASMQQLQEARQRIVNDLRALREDDVCLDVTNQYAVPDFYTAYQGLNDRELQELRASLFRAPREPMLASARPGGRIRLGIASAHLREHAVGRLNVGLISQLDTAEFHVTAIVPGPQKGARAEQIRDLADAYIELPNDLNYSRRVIAGQKLDVLLYPDLGLEPVTYTLAMTRLAPVQCATWGHPVTSGITTVDHFISADALEPEGAETQYTEKLVRLPRLAVCYAAGTGDATSRAEFGLNEDVTVYGCPHPLYQFHPEFDAILAGILRGDPTSLLVLLKAPHVEWEQTLQERFGKSMPDVVGRIRWIPRPEPERGHALLGVFDVLLDPIHFSGSDVSCEALTRGVPVVTLPSALLRGRLTYGMYRQMGGLDCVVDSPQRYIETALRLGSDRTFRKHVSDQIRSAAAETFASRGGVADLEEFLKQVAAQARATRRPA